MWGSKNHWLLVNGVAGGKSPPPVPPPKGSWAVIVGVGEAVVG